MLLNSQSEKDGGFIFSDHPGFELVIRNSKIDSSYAGSLGGVISAI